MNGIRGNAIVGQSGGPTAAINSSLAGVFKQQRTEVQIRYMACFTVSRGFCRSDMGLR